MEAEEEVIKLIYKSNSLQEQINDLIQPLINQIQNKIEILNNKPYEELLIDFIALTDIIARKYNSHSYALQQVEKKFYNAWNYNIKINEGNKYLGVL